MVNDDVIDLVVERLVNRIENVNTYILKQMGESIKAIRDLTPSQAQAMIQILKYGGDFDKIVEKLAEITNLNVKDILDIFEGVAKRDYAFAERFYNYNNKKYIPYKDNRALQNQVDSLGKITAGDYVNLTRTSALGYGIVNDNTGEVEFKGIGEAYTDLLDDAVVSISQGKETFDQAVGRHMKKIAESGLKVVYPTTYVSKTGQVKNYTRRLDSAVREAVRTGLRELHMSNQEMFGNEFGADGVEISVHTNPAPDHAAVQGKQFSNEEFRKFQNDERAVSYDGEVFEPTFNGKDRRAINQYNCYHRTFPIVLGVSKPEYSNEELENIIEENEKGFELDGKKYTNYEGTQLQRKLETKIREQKDLNIMAKASGNNKLVDESQIKINELTDKYKELCQISGLPPLNERLRVAGYRKSKVADSKKENNKVLKKVYKEEMSDYDKMISEWQKDYVEGELKKINGANKEEEYRIYDESLKNKDVISDMSVYNLKDENIRNENLKQLNKLTDKWGHNIKSKMPLYLKTDKLAEKTMGETNSEHGITLNKDYFNNSKKLIRTEENSRLFGWHYKVKDKDLGIYTITHEYGHILENEYLEEKSNNLASKGILKSTEQLDKELKDKIIKNAMRKTGKMTEGEFKNKYFSGYAKSKPNYEWFAELFVQMELGEKTPFTEVLEEWMVSYYK